MEVAAQGSAATLKWLEERNEQGLCEVRKEIVEALQKALMALKVYIDESNTLGKLANRLAPRSKIISKLTPYFEPQINLEKIQHISQPYFAYVESALFEIIIPTNNTLYSEESKNKKKVSSFSHFPYSLDQVSGALNQLSDAYGPVRIYQMGTFRQCACKHPETDKRRVCIAPLAPFRCTRQAVFVRHSLLTASELKTTQADAQFNRRLKKMIAKVQLNAETYIASELGNERFNNEAMDMVVEYRRTGRERKIERKREEENTAYRLKIRGKQMKKLLQVQQVRMLLHCQGN